MNNNIGFTIINHDEVNNSILVRPHSPDFKKSAEEYDCYNISLANLDESKDISSQIAILIKPVVDEILKREDPYRSGAISNFINNNLNKLQSIPAEALMQPDTTVSGDNNNLFEVVS
jgi:hypothetical protein